jgi:hypothetical protein
MRHGVNDQHGQRNDFDDSYFALQIYLIQVNKYSKDSQNQIKRKMKAE